MLRKVESYIENKNLLRPGATVVVGVSGGADSVALLHILNSLAYKCIVAHCNFHLRMDESDRDELFVRNMAEALNLPFYKIDFQTNEYASEHKVSIEMAARDLRYAWFEQLRLTTRAEAIAVAHHADDNAETLLMNIIRGTGIRGLTGIKAHNGVIVRPLLCCSRTEIELYLQKQQVKFVIDSTNAQTDYKRNKIRNQLLPLLEEINPSVRETLNENISKFEDVCAIYEESIALKIDQIVEKKSDEIYINIDLLKSEIASETLLYEITKNMGFHADQIHNIILHLNSESGKTFSSEKYRLIKDRKYLIINKIRSKNINEAEIKISDSSVISPIHLQLKHFQRETDFEISKQADCVHLDAETLNFPLKIRKWKKGDRFYPFGMKGQKKLSDFFTDLKMNMIDKENVYVLVTANNEIVWVVGIRTDNRFRITKKTNIVFEIKLIR